MSHSRQENDSDQEETSKSLVIRFLNSKMVTSTLENFNINGLAANEEDIEKEGFIKKFASFNPFNFSLGDDYYERTANETIAEPTAPQKLSKRLRSTLSVFLGYRSDQVTGWTLELKPKPKLKQGLFSYILGIPSHLVYSIVPAIGLAVTALGLGIWDGAVALTRLARGSKYPRLAMVAAAIPLLAMFIVGGALAAAGMLEYGLTKSVLSYVNWLIQKVAMPIISIAATILVFPIVGLVHLILSKRNHGHRQMHMSEHGYDGKGYQGQGSTHGYVATQTQGQTQGQGQAYGNSPTYNSSVQFEEVNGSHHSTATDSVYSSQYNSSTTFNPVATNVRAQAQSKPSVTPPTYTSYSNS